MIYVEISIGDRTKSIFQLNSPITVNEIWDNVDEELRRNRNNFYAVHNGRLVSGEDICSNGRTVLIPKFLGGKGGFGSMLRAIGAQIEKTTNREACRDLSGRRLRDINEEKRLKAWIEKHTKREEEAAERKRKKLERLCTEPKHEFKDQGYEHERSVLTERVGSAVEEGFKAANAGPSGVKRKQEEEPKSTKKKILLDLDIDSDELDSSDDSETDEKQHTKVMSTDKELSNTDSRHSADESGENQDSSASVEDKQSELSNGTHITEELSEKTKNSPRNTAPAEDNTP